MHLLRVSCSSLSHPAARRDRPVAAVAVKAPGFDGADSVPRKTATLTKGRLILVGFRVGEMRRRPDLPTSIDTF